MKKPFRKKSGPKANNPNAMMAQMQQMQKAMAETQEALEHEYITVTAGGGAITIEISGQQRLRRLEIEPDMLDPEEQEMLQDMLVTAVNQAIEQSQSLAATRMENISAGPSGLNDMLGSLGLG